MALLLRTDSTAGHVAPAVSRRQGYYQGSYSVTTSCAAVPLDVVALGAQSRPARAYAAPLSVSISVYDQPAAVSTDTFTPGINSRPQVAYRGAPSSFSGAADQDPGTMAFVSVSRPQAAPRVSRSQAINVYDNPTAAATDSWASAVTSRQGARNYQGSYSLNIGVGVVPFSTDFVAGINSRPQGRYRGAPSSFSGAADQDPGVMALGAQSRSVSFYLAPRSRTISAFDVTPDSYAAGSQSRPVPYYRGSPSVAGLVLFIEPERFGGGGTSERSYIDPFRDPFRDPMRDSTTNPFRDPFKGKE